MTKIDTIIFDLGGVLIDWNPRYLYKRYFNSNEAMEYFLSNICTPDWNEEQDGGRSFEVATKLLVEQFPQYNKEIVAFYSEWKEMVHGSFPEVVELFYQLKNLNTYRIYALTNWSAESFPKALEMFDFLHDFEGILVSGQEDLKKPDKAIYQLMCNRYFINKDTAVFIDDNFRNIEAAKDFGLQTIHFSNANQLKSELNALNVFLD